MIPRIIHCCWLSGKEKTPLAEKCRASWSAFAPGWEIKEWTAEDFMRMNPPPFAKGAYSAGKWAFAADYLRFAALYEDGGIYLDYDVELVAPLSISAPFVATQFLPKGGTGFEPAVIALEKGSLLAKAVMDEYSSLPFSMNLTAGEIFSSVVERGSFDIARAEREVFSPIDVDGSIRATEKTLAIHHCAMSWAPLRRRAARWMSWHGMRKLVDFLIGARNILWRRQRGGGA